MSTASSQTLVFPVETSFHQKVRRPGGIPREKALRYAKMQVLRLFVRGALADGELRARKRGLPWRCRWPKVSYLAIAADFTFD